MRQSRGSSQIRPPRTSDIGGLTPRARARGPRGCPAPGGTCSRLFSAAARPPGRIILRRTPDASSETFRHGSPQSTDAPLQTQAWRARRRHHKGPVCARRSPASLSVFFKTETCYLETTTDSPVGVRNGVEAHTVPHRWHLAEWTGKVPGSIRTPTQGRTGQDAPAARPPAPAGPHRLPLRPASRISRTAGGGAGWR